MLISVFKILHRKKGKTMHKKNFFLVVIVLLSTKITYPMFSRAAASKPTNTAVGAYLFRSFCQQSETNLRPRNTSGENERISRLKEALASKKYIKNIEYKDSNTIELKVTPIPKAQQKNPPPTSKPLELNPTGC